MVVASEENAFTMFCQRDILYHGLLCLLALIVVIVQATILNFYIIAFYRGYVYHVATYFFFLGDLFVVCLFAISFISVYRYITMKKTLRSKGGLTEHQIETRVVRAIYKHIMFLKPRYCGTLPLSFLSWGAYSSLLVSKVSVIFTSDIPAFMTNSSEQQQSLADDPVSNLNANLLKVTIGLAALIFIIMLQTHDNHGSETATSGYISGVCHNMAIEVFDSVTLLSLLVVEDKDSHFLKIRNLSSVIIVLASINLILPTITLYSLSLSDFGLHLKKIIPIKMLYQLIHLIGINIPYLVVRIYLWVAFNYDLSVFVVKNVCYIFMLVHNLFPGVAHMTKYVLGKGAPPSAYARSRVSHDNSNDCKNVNRREEILQAMRASSEGLQQEQLQHEADDRGAGKASGSRGGVIVSAEPIVGSRTSATSL